VSGVPSVPLETACNIEYGTRVVQKRDGGAMYPVYGGGGETFRVDQFNRENRLVVARFGMSKECARFVPGKFFLNDSGLTVSPRSGGLSQRFLDYQLLSLSAAVFALGKGSAQKNLDVPAFRRIPLWVPHDVSVQDRIVAILDEAFASIASAKTNTEKNLQNVLEVFQARLAAAFASPGSEWTHARLEQVTRFIDYRGKTPTKTEEGVRLITAKNVKMGYVQAEPAEFIASGDYDGWMTRGIPRRGDVLFTTEAPLANVAQLETDEKVAFAQRVIVMQPDADVIDGTCLKYLLMSAPVQQRIRAEGTGATVQGIKASLLKKVEIAFPKKPTEQRVLVGELDATARDVSRLEALQIQKIAALDGLKQSLLHQAFAGEL